MTVADIVVLRILYLATVIGVGGAGAVVLFAPKVADQRLFYGAVRIDAYTRIIGAVWLGLGVIAAVGLLHPREMTAVLLVQLVYKAIWLAAGAAPALISGKRDTGLLLLTVLYIVWALGILLLFPFAAVFGGA
ncbi:MAG: hypothetical protein ACLFQ5_08560 [Oceanicaulis sp.]